MMHTEALQHIAVRQHMSVQTRALKKLVVPKETSLERLEAERRAAAARQRHLQLAVFPVQASDPASPAAMELALVLELVPLPSSSLFSWASSS
jgi:hypothetical protein